MFVFMYARTGGLVRFVRVPIAGNAIPSRVTRLLLDIKRDRAKRHTGHSLAGECIWRKHDSRVARKLTRHYSSIRIMALY